MPYQILQFPWPIFTLEIRVSRSVKLPDRQEDMNMGMAAFGLHAVAECVLQLQTHNYFFREIPFLR